MKKILAVISILIITLASCSKAITPWEAANGKARCGKHLR